MNGIPNFQDLHEYIKTPDYGGTVIIHRVLKPYSLDRTDL